MIQPIFYSFFLFFILKTAFFLFFIFSSSQGCSFSQFNNQCFKIITSPTPFYTVHEARSLCLNDGWDLGSIISEEENIFVKSLIANSTANQREKPSHVVIGLSDVPSSSAGTFQWLNGRVVNFTNYTNPVSNFYSSDRVCFSFHSSQKLWDSPGDEKNWQAIPCCFSLFNIKHVLCQDYVSPQPVNKTLLKDYCFGDCPTGWKYFSNKCYVISKDLSTSSNASDSRRKCLSKGGDLISYNNMNKNFIDFYLKNLYISQQNTAIKLFLGLTKLPNLSFFKNLDGSDPPSSPSISSPVLTSNNEESNCTLIGWNYQEILVSMESCCSNFQVPWLGCEKDEQLSREVGWESDELAISCYQEINECISNPCLNGGTCLDLINRFNCSCPPPYSGVFCEITFTPCTSNPCVNGGTCVENSSSYSCTCSSGYNGTNCQTKWDQCLNNPCQNNGTCEIIKPQVNVENYSYICFCNSFTSGYDCEIDNTDECLSNPCIHGNCLNLIGQYKCNCNQGKTGLNCDQDVKCSNLTSSVDFAILLNSTGRGVDYGDEMYFQCQSGYLFEDTTSVKTVTCSENNQWSDPLILEGCKESCPFVPVVHNSTRDKTSITINTTITFTCNKGYAIDNNASSVSFTCQSDKTWSPSTTLLQCTIRKCPPLPQNPNQSLNPENQVTFGTLVTFWCEAGYQLHDNTSLRTVKCLENGEWSADLPICQPVTCPEVSVANHQSRNTSSTEYLTYAQYSCDKGYRMLDGSEYKIIVCEADRKWSDIITNCSADRCFPLPYVSNATPSTTDANYWTQTVLTCIPGHKFKRTKGEYSSDIMICQENGWWNPILTSCEPIFCPEIFMGLKNMTRNSDSRLYGTMVTYTCFKGHYIDLSTLLNTFETTCTDTQDWSDPFVPSCSPIKCKEPPSPSANGQMNIPFPNGHYYSEVVYYSCNDGTKFINGQRSKTVLCNELGVWNESDVTCKSERCDAVSILPNSFPDNTSTDWGVVITYFCKKGHYREDGLPWFAIYCKPGAFWNATYDATKDCKIKSCPPPPLFPNSTINSTSSTVYGTVFQITCDPGFRFFEEDSLVKNIQCDENANWSPSNFTACQIISCNELPDVKNATKDSNETQYNTEVTFTCFPGFQFPDKSKSQVVKCTENATWSSTPQNCEVVFCPPVPYWSQAIFNTTDNNFFSSVEYHCKEGFAFKSSRMEPGNQTILFSTCLSSKQWVPSIENCYSLEAINAGIAGKAWESPQGVSLGMISSIVIGMVVGIILFIDLRKIWVDLQLMKVNIKTAINSRKKTNKVAPE